MTAKVAIFILECVETHGIVDDAKKRAIEALKAEPQRWIPVTEREPDDGAHVLVTLRWSADDYEVTEADWAFDAEWFADKITAWMPLPEPYKGQSTAGQVNPDRAVNEPLHRNPEDAHREDFGG